MTRNLQYIDNVKFALMLRPQGRGQLILAVTGETWLKLTNGTHTLTITATDGFDETTRTFTIYQVRNHSCVQQSLPHLLSYY